MKIAAALTALGEGTARTEQAHGEDPADEGGDFVMALAGLVRDPEQPKAPIDGEHGPEGVLSADSGSEVAQADVAPSSDQPSAELHTAELPRAELHTAGMPTDELPDAGGHQAGTTRAAPSPAPRVPTAAEMDVRSRALSQVLPEVADTTWAVDGEDEVASRSSGPEASAKQTTTITLGTPVEARGTATMPYGKPVAVAAGRTVVVTDTGASGSELDERPGHSSGAATQMGPDPEPVEPSARFTMSSAGSGTSPLQVAAAIGAELASMGGTLEAVPTPAATPTPQPSAPTPQAAQGQATSMGAMQIGDIAIPEAAVLKAVSQSGKNQSAAIQVEHPVLGTIQLELANDGGGLEVRVLAATQAAAVALRASESGLRASIAAHGVRLRGLKVEVKKGAKKSPRVRGRHRGALDTEA